MTQWIAVTVSIAAIVVAILSYVSSKGSEAAARRSADAAEREANAVLEAEHRAREPRYEVTLLSRAEGQCDKAIYSVKLVTPDPIDDVLVFRPRPADQIKYPVGLTDGPGGFADDEIHLGPMGQGDLARFTLSCGLAPNPPRFEVRIVSVRTSDNDARHWSTLCRLPEVRTGYRW